MNKDLVKLRKYTMSYAKVIRRPCILIGVLLLFTIGRYVPEGV